MGKFPWIGQTPELISGKHWRAIGKARLLLDFYTQRQTHPDGRVNYGKPISYAWIRKQIPECPPERTLKRYTARLRAGGYIEASTVTRGHLNLGMRVKILNQAKFAPAAPPRQMGFFTEPVQMPVQKSAGAEVLVRTKVAPIGGHNWPPNSLSTDTGYETNKTPAASPRAKPPYWKTAKAKQLLAEIERYREVYAGSGPGELDMLRERLTPLYEQLRRLGYVFGEPAEAGDDSSGGRARVAG